MKLKLKKKAKKIMKSLNPLILALLSWGASLIVSSHLIISTWSNIVTFGLVDIFFFWLISQLNMSSIKKRYMCVILSLSIIYNLIWSILAFLYVNSNYHLIDNIHNLIFNNHQVAGFTLSLLLLLVSILPKSKLHDFDKLAWPNFASNIFNYSTMPSNKKTKKRS